MMRFTRSISKELRAIGPPDLNEGGVDGGDASVPLLSAAKFVDK